MITEGSRLEYLNGEIEKLEKLYDNISMSPNATNKKSHFVLFSLKNKIEKLNKERIQWETLYQSISENVDMPMIQQTNIISQDFVNYIKIVENGVKEGFNKETKLWFPHVSKEDPSGYPTIAYGHKIMSKHELDNMNKGITEEQATKLLNYDLKIAEKRVHQYIKKRYKIDILLTEQQKEMLIDFSFNLGGLDKFPKFVDAVLHNRMDIVRKEYIRSSNGKELVGRNKAFFNRYLKSTTRNTKQGIKESENTHIIKKLIMEGIKEKTVEEFIRETIKGTEWEGKVFIAGGYVRDELMGRDSKDLDLLVNAPNGGIEFAKWITKKVGAYRGGPDVKLPTEPQPPRDYTGIYHGGEDPNVVAADRVKSDKEYIEYRIKHEEWEKIVQNLEKQSAGSNPVIFPRFGTARFNLRKVIYKGIDLSDMDIEAVMPRKEQYRTGSRKPTVSGGELKDDVDRRDFTVNSLLKDLSTGEILDLTGMGKQDIKNGIIRTPLDPDKIFTDDPLRMLRAIRFSAKYDWKLPMFMIRSLKKNASQLENISQERIRDELDKMIVTSVPRKALEMLRITGLLKYVIPEFTAAIKMVQNVHHKSDVFGHTLDVVSSTQPKLIQRLIALFHDIGKTVTKTVTPTGIHFYGHEDASAEIAKKVMRRLKYPTELIHAVVLGVKNHMKLKHGGDTAVNLSDKSLRKFKFELGQHLEDTLDVIHADNISHSEASSMPNQIEKVRQRLKTLDIQTDKPKLPINGKDLIDMGLKPGPVFTEILTAITDAWLENPNITKDEAIVIARQIVGNKHPLKEEYNGSKPYYPITKEHELQAVDFIQKEWRDTIGKTLTKVEERRKEDQPTRYCDVLIYMAKKRNDVSIRFFVEPGDYGQLEYSASTDYNWVKIPGIKVEPIGEKYPVTEAKDEEHFKDWLERHKAILDEKGRVMAYHGTSPANAKKIKLSGGFKQGSNFTLRPHYARHWGSVVFNVLLPVDAIEPVASDLVSTRFITLGETGNQV